MWLYLYASAKISADLPLASMMITGIGFFFFNSVNKNSIVCGCPPSTILILGTPS